jgi:sulfotransferase family protein
MWIFCCGMARSGSTLQYQITSQLVEDANIGHRVAWHGAAGFAKVRKQYAGDMEWKVFKSHFFTSEMGEEFANGAKGIYIYRDIRDVIVSVARKQEVSASTIIHDEFIYKRLTNYTQWTLQPRVLVSRYDDIINNLPTEVRRIAEHLEINVDDRYCKQLADKYSLEAQKKRIAISIQTNNVTVLDKGRTFNHHSLLHTNHIQDGGINIWKETLSNYEIGKIEAIAGDWLSAHGYELNSKSKLWRQLFKLRKHFLFF